MPPTRAAAVAIAITIAAPARAAEAPAPVRDRLIAIVQALFDALGTDHKDVWEKNLTADAVVVDEFGRRQTRAEAVADIRAFPPGLSGSIQIREPHVFVYGDAAIVECEAYEQESVFDQKLVVRYRQVFSFVRQDGAWKVAAIAGATLPTPPPLLDVPGLKLDEYTGTYRWGSRAFIVGARDGRLSFVTRVGGRTTTLEPLGKDVFMEDGDERNLVIFRRGAGGRVDELIERRKFNDLHAHK